MNGQVAEKQDVAGARRARGGIGNRVFVHWQMMGAVVEVFESSQLVAAGYDANASTLERSVVKMDDGRQAAL